jgi:hypothetical protein
MRFDESLGAGQFPPGQGQDIFVPQLTQFTVMQGVGRNEIQRRFQVLREFVDDDA